VLSCGILLGWAADEQAPRRRGPCWEGAVHPIDPVRGSEEERPSVDSTCSGPWSSEPAERRLLCAHDVRDLIAAGYSVENIVGLVESECPGTQVAVRVNVLEIEAAEGTQAHVERLLEGRRQAGPHRVLRIHPVADLVGPPRLLEPEVVLDEHWWEPSPPPDEIEQRLLHGLAERVSDTVEGADTIHVCGRNLVAYAGSTVHEKIATLLDALRESRDEALACESRAGNG
jgi:hypothetical protein